MTNRPTTAIPPIDANDGDTPPNDGGYVAAAMGLMIILLLAFAGYSVDVGNWNLQRNKASAAAEAASLGGVTFLPDDPATAVLTAEQIARHHGYSDAEIDARIGDAPNKLEVTISRDVTNYFVRVIGDTTTDITEDAIAEYAQPVEMGSPTVILGNDPETGYSPDYWLNIAGQNVAKEHGDRFNTIGCTFGEYGCIGFDNEEYDPSGYEYSVRVTDATSPLRIQIFDPAWIWTGNFCTIPDWPDAAQLAALQALDDGSNPDIPSGYYDDALTRYAGGVGDFCTGDESHSGSIGPATRYSVLLPDNTPWDDTDNVQVGASTCTPKTFSAIKPTNQYGFATTSIYEYLDPTDAAGGTDWQVDPTDGVFTFAEVFRQWVTVCEINPGTWLIEGDYIVKVETVDYNDGQNRFSLRAGPPDALTGGVQDVGQSIYARNRFPIFVNTDGADTRFFLARVPPSADERILRVELFDMGDALNSGSVSIEPPSDSNMTGFQFCDFQRSDGVDLTTGSNCRINGVEASAGFNGQSITVDVPIPASYTCDFVDPDGCWVTVRARFPGGVHDATTWTAELIGDSVRLVPE